MIDPTSKQDSKNLKVYVSGSNRKPYDSKSGSVALFTFSRAVFGRGLEISRDLSINPGFIKSWAWDFEAEKYVLKVDTSKSFHNGRHITAYDVEFMLLKSNLSPINLKARKWLMNIEGISDLKPGTGYRRGMVKGVRVISEDTLEIKLSRPNPAFLFNLGRGIPSLVPPELVSDDLINFKGSPVGTGEYAVAFDDPKSTAVSLKKARDLDSKAPATVDLINEGEPTVADIVIGPRINPLEGKYVPVYGESAASVSTIMFNYTNPAGKNPNFRAAVHYALDRREIAKDRPFFKPAYEYLVEGNIGRVKAKDPFDPDRARRYVALLPDSIRNTPQTIFFYGKLEWNPQLKVVERQLEDVGLKVKIVGVNGQKIRLEAEDRDVAMFMAGQLSDYLDPLNCFADYLPGSIDTLQHPVNDEAYVALFEVAMNAKSLEERSKSLEALSTYFLEQHIAVPVVEQKQIFWIDPTKVETLKDMSSGTELNLSGVRLK